MKHVEKWKWRYRWSGRNVTSAVHLTEEEALRAHPDAMRIEGSMKAFEMPETPEERREAYRLTDTSAFLRKRD